MQLEEMVNKAIRPGAINEISLQRTGELLEIIKQQHARIKRYEEALRFYADGNNFKLLLHAYAPGARAQYFLEDSGERARKALEEK